MEPKGKDIEALLAEVEKTIEHHRQQLFMAMGYRQRLREEANLIEPLISQVNGVESELDGVGKRSAELKETQ